MSFGIIAFLKAAAPGRGSVPVADDQPLPVYQASFPATGTPGALSFRVQSAATTNATSVKASPGVLNSLALTNSAGTAAFFKLYNKASAPTVGTDVPIATYAIPANGSLVINNLAGGKFFSAGIAYAITNLVADSDTTAVAANQITGSGEYA